jgi:hypothetical protein
MGLFKRYDGVPAKVPYFRNVEPHVMQTRDESVGYLNIQFDLTETMPFIKKLNEEAGHDKKTRFTLFHVLLTAMVRTISLYPHLNRFISGRKYWQRNRLNMSFVVKKQLTAYAKETFAKMDFDPYSTVESIRKQVHDHIHVARSDAGNETEDHTDDFGKLPRWVLRIALKLINFLEYYGWMPKSMIEPDPLYCSVVLANLGSVGLQGQILHHIFNYGNASLFIVVGKIHKVPVVVEIDGKDEIVVREIVDIGVTIDERISEGLYYMLALKKVQHLVEHPEELLERPNIPEKELKTLGLIDLESLKKKRKKINKKQAKKHKKAEKAKK